MARIEGTILKLFDKLAKTTLLIIEDFGLVPPDKQQQMDINEDPHGRAFRIVISQLPVADWQAVFGEETDTGVYW